MSEQPADKNDFGELSRVVCPTDPLRQSDSAASRHCEHGWLFQCDYCERVGLCAEPSRAWAVESAAAVGWMVKDSGLCRCPGCAKQL